MYKLEVQGDPPEPVETVLPSGVTAVRSADNGEDFEFVFPQAVTVDDEGYVYVVDKRAHRVEKFQYDDSGSGPIPTVRHLPNESFGGLGREPGKFIYPYSVAVDTIQNRVFVTDMGNGRIQVFMRSGARPDEFVWGKWYPPKPQCEGEVPADWVPPEAELEALAAPPGLSEEERATFQLIHGVTIRCGTAVVVGVGRQLFEFSWKGDFDGDGDVDQDDFAHFDDCYSGPHVPSECGDADFEGDGDVDGTDFARFQANYTGPLGCPGT